MTKSTFAPILLLAVCGAVFAQEQNQFKGSDMAGVKLAIPVDQLPEFSVIDAQPCKTKEEPRARFQPGGRVEFLHVPMKLLVLAAWGWENDESRLAGGPSWVSSDKFDIIAKATPDTQIVDLRLMLRSMLIKRFGLEYHMQDQVRPVYALERGKGAPRLTPSAKQERLDCKRSNENGMMTQTCHNMTMDELANALQQMAPAYVDKPVVNLTGLDGQFDFKFSWMPRRMSENRGAGDGAPQPDGSVLNTSDAGGPTLFEGVDKWLGLKLTSTRHGMPIIVIEKVNQTPVEN
jgi:uncharacterized protein (TIGR03435 family)